MLSFLMRSSEFCPYSGRYVILYSQFTQCEDQSKLKWFIGDQFQFQSSILIDSLELFAYVDEVPFLVRFVGLLVPSQFLFKVVEEVRGWLFALLAGP